MVKPEPIDDSDSSYPENAPADAGDGEPHGPDEVPGTIATDSQVTIPGELIHQDDNHVDGEAPGLDELLTHVESLGAEPEPPTSGGSEDENGHSHGQPPSKDLVGPPQSQVPAEPPSSASTPEASPPDVPVGCGDAKGLEITPAPAAKPDPPNKDVEMPPPPVPVNKRPRDDLFVTSSIPPPVLSDSAVYNRLWRVFKAKKDGACDVDERWVKAWQDVKGGRVELYSMFEKTGYSVDKGLTNMLVFSKHSCLLCTSIYSLLNAYRVGFQGLAFQP